LFILGIESPIPCLANSYVINPSDDGSIYEGGIVNASSSVTCANNMRGIIEFPIDAINGQIETATLSINPYELPLYDPIVHVCGFSSTDGRLTSLDYYDGLYLGDWALPDLNFGQDAYFDVTFFMKTVTTPYVGFNLRANGDSFCSLELNYGHPSQLSVVTVPEPGTLLLFTFGGLALHKSRLAGRRKR
jgi:hypothetical protein